MRLITIIVITFLFIGCQSDHAKLIRDLVGTYEGTKTCTIEVNGTDSTFILETTVKVELDTFYGDMLVIKDYLIPITEEELTFKVNGGCASNDWMKGEFDIGNNPILIFEEYVDTGILGEETCIFIGDKLNDQ